MIVVVKNIFLRDNLKQRVKYKKEFVCIETSTLASPCIGISRG